MKSSNQEATTQKTLNISITKIFNWPASQPECTFDLVFLSQLENSPIINKTVYGNFSVNSMNLNAHLKITYTGDQSKVILKLYRQPHVEELGAFQIDLEELGGKGVLYYPFGKDQVLQVNRYDYKNVEAHPNPNGDRMTNTLQRYKSQGNLYRGERNSSSRMLATNPSYYQRQSETGYNRYDFQSRVLGLLKQVRQMKSQAGLASRLTGFHTRSNSQNKLTITKSISQKNLLNTRQRELRSRDKKGQRHRLMLQTLNIVPCQAADKYDSYYIH